MADRVKSANELKVIANSSLVKFYNDFVLPLSAVTRKNFRPMSEGENTGLCPFHQDTDPSFHYWRGKEVFHCFGCGFGGDVVRTYMQLRRQHYNERITVERAVEELAAHFGIDLDPDQGFVVPSVFERAKSLLLDKSTYHIPKSQFSLASFRENNNKVKRSPYDLKIKIDNFEMLDLMASVELSKK